MELRLESHTVRARLIERWWEEPFLFAGLPLISAHKSQEQKGFTQKPPVINGGLVWGGAEGTKFRWEMQLAGGHSSTGVMAGPESLVLQEVKHQVPIVPPSKM